MKPLNARPKLAVHKFSSCDGCQLAILNMGAPLLELTQRVEIVHFLEAGFAQEDAQVDIALVEGSISTPAEHARIKRVRENSRLLITIGACATSGGIQALRNVSGAHDQWRDAVYAKPEFIETLHQVQPVSSVVHVDFELWGCPITSKQLIAAVNALLFGVPPIDQREKVCLECKRQQAVCVMVAEGKPCLGPVTRTGCGALCPSFGRDCYGCFGPSEATNTASLARRFEGLGLLPEQVVHKFSFINSQAPEFKAAATAQRASQTGTLAAPGAPEHE